LPDSSNIFITLYHNFWSRNPSKSSKVSKDSDCSLVSNNIFSEILPSGSLGPGPGEVGQGGLKALHLWHHSKNPHLQTKKIFFVGNYKTCRVFGFSSSHLKLLWLRLHSPGTDRSLGKIWQLSDPAQDTRVLTITNEHL